MEIFSQLQWWHWLVGGIILIDFIDGLADGPALVALARRLAAQLATPGTA